MNKTDISPQKKYAWCSFRCRYRKDDEVTTYLAKHPKVFKEIKIFEEDNSQNTKKENAKIWPGNIFIKIELKHGKISQETKDIIMQAPHFMRFNSYQRSYFTDPVLFSDKHIKRLEEKIKNKQKLTTGKFKPEDIDFEINDLVSVLLGVFRGYEGEVTEIDYDTGIITLNVEFFGRITPIKVGFLECKKKV